MAVLTSVVLKKAAFITLFSSYHRRLLRYKKSKAMDFTRTIIHSSFLTKARQKNEKTLGEMIPATMRTNVL